MSFTEGPPGFAPFDPDKPVHKHRRHLPHWTQAGATYFVTFHLADSLPAAKLAELREIRSAWERQHPEPRGDGIWRELSREIIRRVETWLDSGSGACHLAQPALARVVGNALLHFHGDRYAMNAWCVMPNHVHALFRPGPAHEPRDILHSWKSFTAQELNRRLGRRGALWQQESYDTIIRDAAHLAKAVRYIGQNPAKVGLVHERWHRWIDPDWERSGWGFREGNDQAFVREGTSFGDFPV